MTIADSMHVDANLLSRYDKLHSGYILKTLRIASYCIDPIIADLLELPALSQGAETWFQHPSILLWVRLWPAQAGHYRKG